MYRRFQRLIDARDTVRPGPVPQGLMPHRPALLLLSLLGLVACAQLPSQEKPRAAIEQQLEPVPAPPDLSVPAEKTPGSASKLVVVTARPVGEDVSNVRPTITFSRPVVGLEQVDALRQLPAPATITPALSGEWRWIGSSSVEFIPKGRIPFATSYKVTVAAGLTALDGTRLDKPYTFEFSTPRPILWGVSPDTSEGSPFLQAIPTQEFELRFSQPVKDLSTMVEIDPGPPRMAIKIKVLKEIDENQENEEEARKEGRTPSPRDTEGLVYQPTRYRIAPLSKLPLDSSFSLVISPKLKGKDGTLATNRAYRYPFKTHGAAGYTAVRACMFFGYDYECGDAPCRCSYGPLLLLTSTELDVASLKSRLTVDPPVAIDWERVESFESTQDTENSYSAIPRDNPQVAALASSPYVVLPGKWRPGTQYTLKVAPGAKDVFGQVAPAFEGTVATDNVEPELSYDSDVALLEASGDGAIPIKTVNLSSVEADVWSVTPAELARLLHPPVVVPSRTPTKLRLDVRGTPNVSRWSPLSLRKANPAGKKTGLFVTRFRSPELPATQAAERIVAQITDLAVHAKLGAKSGTVWVTSLASGKPVPNARLELYDGNGTRKWEGQADASGVGTLPGLASLMPAENEWETPFAMVAATKDQDVGVTLSTWTGGFWPGAFGLSTDTLGNRTTSLGFMVADRGIYRPGDEVFIKGLARYRTLEGILLPPKDAVFTITVTSPNDDEVFKTTAKASRFGTFDTRLKLEADVPLGFYYVSASTQVDGQELSYSGEFRVEEYRAPQFKVDVEAPAKEVVAGENLQANVLARYLFGGAMAEAPVRWSVTRTSASFVPPGIGDFVVGTYSWWWDDGEPEPGSDIFASGEGLSDSTGTFALQGGKAEAPGAKAWEYTLEAEVEDISRQRIANRATVLVHPAAYYAGLRVAGGGFAQAGKPSRLELIAVAPDGKRVEGIELTLDIKRREWKSVKKKGMNGRYFTESEPVEVAVHSCKARSTAATASCDFTPDKPGFYLLEASITDGQGRKQSTRDALYAVGDGWVSWQRDDSEHVDLVADKQLYEVGEKARILIKNPYPQAEALVTLEREGILFKKVITLQGAAATVELPLDESCLPNVYVGVVISRGRVGAKEGLETGEDPGRPAIRLGYTELKVERRSKRLNVEVTPDAVERRPRDKVKLNLKVTDFQGQGTPAELAVWAVDEGVLRLTDYKIPDPVEAVHENLGLAVRVGEPLLHLVLRRLYGEKGQVPGGGGMDSSGSGLRTNFKTTAVFLPTIETDAQGNATAEFILPDNLTTFRIMALAVTTSDRFGTGESKVTVSRPLLALPALPRVARVGDTFEAGVVLHTKGIQLDKAKVVAEVEGLTLKGKASQTVQLTTGKPREVRFTFTAEQEGTATLRFLVTGGKEKDGVEQHLPILLPVSMEAVATYGETTSKQQEAISPPGAVRTDRGGLELSLASTALGGFDENLRQLVDYPYGCLEQLSSRLVPYVSLLELSKTFGLTLAEPSKADQVQLKLLQDLFSSWLGDSSLKLYGAETHEEVVKRTVRAIQDLQNSDGGFRYWPSSTCSSEWASSYAVLALARAKQTGFKVDQAVLANGVKYLADTVAAGKPTPCAWGRGAPDDVTRVFALYTLARVGQPKASYYTELFGRRAKLPLFARAMLADALYVGKGDRKQARQLVTELMNQAKESAGAVHFEEADAGRWATLWSSDTRTTAIVLQTLVTVQPDHPFIPKLARYLTTIRRGDGRFRNTQEAAFAMLALTDLVRYREKEAPAFQAKVLLGDRLLAELPFQGRSMQVQHARVDISALKTMSGQLPLVFSKDGVGILYYSALFRYAPAELPTKPLEQGLVVQRWFEPLKGGGQARQFNAGDLVRIRVRVASPMERQYVAIDVPLPAGLEPADTSLASTARSLAAALRQGDMEESEEEDDSDPWARAFWSPFNHVEQRDDRVALFADTLPAGVYSTSFVARATTPGDFVLKPAYAAEMYAPEVFGRSDGGRFQVMPPGTLVSR